MGQRWNASRGTGFVARAVVLGVLLSAGVAAAAGELLLGAEQGVDGRAPGFNFRAQYAGTALAAGAQGASLAVWAENRNGIFTPGWSRYDLYATRLAADGTPLDAEPLAISRAVGNQTAPAVAFDGSQYLVVWQDTRCEDQTDLYGARVKADGTVLDAGGFLIASEVGAQEAPRVAYQDGLFLVVWTDRRTEDMDIYGARVKPDGTSLDPSGFPIAFTGGHESGVAVAAGTAGFRVTWSTASSSASVAQKGIWMAHVDASGQRVEASPTLLASDGWGRTLLAFDGARFLVVWTEAQPGTVCWTYSHGETDPCPRLGGAVLAPDGSVVRVSLGLAPRSDVFELAAVTDGSGPSRFLVTGSVSTTGTIASYWFDANGNRLGQVEVASGGGGNPSVAGVGGRGAVVFSAQGSVHVSWQASEGAAPAPVNLLVSSQVANEQSFPAVASDGTHALAVWLDNRNGGNDLYGVRLGPDGAPVGGTVRIVSATEATGNLHAPAVAFGGGVYFVVWSDDRGTWVSGARVAQDGTLLDATPLKLTDSARAMSGRPSVASDGTDFLVAWPGANFSSSRDVYGTRVSAQGTLLGSRLQLTSLPSEDAYPSLSYQGTQYLLVWRHRRPQGGLVIAATRVGRDGQVLDPSGILLETASGQADHPIAAFDGTNTLVVWRKDAGPWGGVIQGARLSPGGTLLDSTPLTLSGSLGGSISPPALTFDGTDHVAAWVGEVHPEVVSPATSSLTAFHIRGVRVRPDGTVRDLRVLELAGNNVQQHEPTLARVGAGTSLLLYHQFEPDPPVHALRLRVRALGNGTCATASCVAAPWSQCPVTGPCFQPLPEGSCPPGTPPVPGPTPKEDAGTPPDAGQGSGDGGTPDAGSAQGADAGTPSETSPEPGACGCGAVGGPGTVLLLAWALLLRRVPWRPG